MDKLKLITKLEKIIDSVKSLKIDFSKDDYNDEELAFILTLTDELMHVSRFDELIEKDYDFEKISQAKLDIFNEYKDELRQHTMLFEKAKTLIKEKIFTKK